MDRLIRFSLSYPRLIVVGTGVLFVLSLFASLKLPLDALPDIVSLEMEVNTGVDAFSPEEVEKQVTIPLERALAGIPGLVAMRSTSQFGLSQIELIFQDSLSIVATRQLINERIQAVRDSLPPDTQPILAPVKSGLGEILYYSIDYTKMSPEYGQPRLDQLISLKRYQVYTLGPQVAALPGVAEVSATGGFTPQINIDVDPVRFMKSGLEWFDLTNSLRRSATRSGGGILQFKDDQVTVKSDCNLTDPGQINDLSIISRSGHSTSLRDVADTHWGTEARTGAALENGEEGLVMAVVMQRGENARVVTQRVVRFLQETQKTLPSGMQLNILYNRGDLIDATIGTIRKNLLFGALIVVLVLFTFLGNWRAAFIVATSIPLAFFIALFGLSLTPYSGNLISLGAVDFGLIVDGAVVLTENIVRRLAIARKKEGRITNFSERFDIIEEAAGEVVKPVIFGICIITMVYVPIFALTGVEGKMFQPLATTLIFALTAALLIALTLIPALCFLMLGRYDHSENKLLNRLREVYVKILGFSFAFKRLTLAIYLLLLIASLLCFVHLGGEFVPRLNEGTILMPIERPARLGLEASVEMQMKAEDIILRDFPEVRKTFSRVGSDDEAVDAVGVNEADTYLTLRPNSQWRMVKGHYLSREELLDAIQNDLNEKIPDQNISFSQPVEDRFNDFLEGARSDLVIKVFGDDLSELERLGAEIRDVAQTVKGVADVNFDLAGRNPTIEIHPRFDTLRSYGLSQADINQQVVRPLAGEEMGILLVNGYPVDEVVRLPQHMRDSLDSIASLPIRLSKGGFVPLQKVATLETHDQLNEIERDSGHRRVAITMNIRGRDLVGCVEEVRRQVAEKVILPNGYLLDYGGHYRIFQSTCVRLFVIIPAVIALILIFLYASCRSWREALIIMTGVPFAFTGGIIALALRGLPLSIPAIIGFIALSGIAVLNGLVLVNCVKQLAADLNWMEAILTGCKLRLRPVLMTALVGSLGFLPMVLAQGTGAEVQRPLATVVFGGIISSTFLTLILVPLLLAIFKSNQGEMRELQSRNLHE